MREIERQVIDVENHILDAIEKCQEYKPATVIFAAVGLLTRMAHDFAPSEEAANDLLRVAMSGAFESEPESTDVIGGELS